MSEDKEKRRHMSNEFSVTDTLFQILQELDDREEIGGSLEDTEEVKKHLRTICTLRRWPEAAFLEHAKLILTDTSYNNIQKITLENDKVVYLIPESFYNSKIKAIKVEVDET